MSKKVLKFQKNEPFQVGVEGADFEAEIEIESLVKHYNDFTKKVEENKGNPDVNNQLKTSVDLSKEFYSKIFGEENGNKLFDLTGGKIVYIAQLNGFLGEELIDYIKNSYEYKADVSLNEIVRGTKKK